MSLSKQLLILITFIFFIVFAVNFILSMGNIRSYLEVESEIHVQDTATSLGLSLSPHMVDEKDPIIRTMMNAIFDMGYYKEMRLLDVDGQELIRLTNTDIMPGVPEWLIELVPMKVATAVSEISSGWNISGTLYVSTNPGYGYLKLYEQGIATLKFSLMIFLAAVILLIVALRFTLKSLKNIEKQANEISAGNFTIISRLPWTLEVKSVAQSMNSMSNKIGSMIARLNRKLEILSDSLKRDTLTKLFNQVTFNQNLKQTLASGKSGYAALIKFDDLGFIAKSKGNKAVDNILIEFAKLLNTHEKEGISAYRLYGSEFAMILPELDSTAVTTIADELKLKITALGLQYEIDDLIHIGIIHYGRSSDFDKLSPAMVEAYEQARIIGNNAYFIKSDSVSSMSDQEWKTAITTAIDKNMPEISLVSEAFNYAGTTVTKVMEEAFTQFKDRNGDKLAIGTFFSMAQEFGLEKDLDKCIVNQILLLMESKKQTVPVTINLSMTAIASNEFREWLQARVKQSNIKPELLAFSATAYSAAKDLTTFTDFSLFVQSIGSKTLLKRYSSDIIAIDRLKDLQVDYIRLARDLTTDIGNNSNKSTLLDIMNEVATLLDIKVIAEGVVDDEDFDHVKNAEIYGIGR